MKTFQITCPQCRKSEFGSLQQIYLTYPVKGIYENGEIIYDRDNPIAGNGQVLGIQCLSCGFELNDKDGNPLIDSLEVLSWVKHHGLKN